jgi:hypothetical protein
MPTSLPPSPIAAILCPFVYFFNSWVISAFWVGEHLQTQTQGAWIATLKKSSWTVLSDKIVSSVYPSMIRVVFFRCL